MQASMSRKRSLRRVSALLIAAGLVSGCLTSGGGGQPAPPTDAVPPPDSGPPADGGGGRGNASVTLSWTPPTQNEDGSVLTDLAGYRLHYGTRQGEYDTTIGIDNPSVSTYVVEGLDPGTYYFVASSYTTSGIESRYSNVAVKTAE